MTRMFLSFTATFIQWFNGTIKCTPEDRYRFNCTRTALCLNNLEYVPIEITFVNKKDRMTYTEPLRASVIDPILLQKFREFQGIILLAENKDNVLYRQPYKNCIASRPYDWLTDEEKNDPAYMALHKFYFPRPVLM